MPFRPRIYQFEPSAKTSGAETAGLLATVESEIRAAAAVGFDHLMCDAAATEVLQAAKAAGMASLLHLASLAIERGAWKVKLKWQPHKPLLQTITCLTRVSPVHSGRKRR
jgi:hypothetical protein